MCLLLARKAKTRLLKRVVRRTGASYQGMRTPFCRSEQLVSVACVNTDLFPASHSAAWPFSVGVYVRVCL